MKRKKKSIFFLLSALGGGGAGGGPVYLDPQDGPVFTDQVILAQGGVANPGSIFPTDCGGHRQILLRNTWDLGIALNGMIGLRGLPVELKNEDGNTLCGSLASSNHGISTLNGTNFVHLWGSDKNTPLKVTSLESGISFGPIPTVVDRGMVFRAYNVCGINTGYAIFLLSAGAAGYEWKVVAHSFIKGKGNVSEGEGGYYGHDTAFAGYLFRKLVVLHHAFMDKGREGEQFRFINLLISYNRTTRNVGNVVGQPGQNNNSQFQDTNGFDYYFVEDGAPIVENTITHGVTRKFGYTRCASNAGATCAPGYIGRANDHWPGSPRLNASYSAGVKKLIMSDRDIAFDSPVGYIWLIEERDCDIDLININSNASGVFLDGRGATPPNTITQTNVQLVLRSAIPDPTYMSDDVNSKDFCKITSTSHYNRGLGAHTPVAGNQAIVDVSEIADISVPQSTAFGANGITVGLPQVASWLCQDGLYHILGITWASGAYDGNTPGVYSVFGAPTIVGAFADTYSTRLEAVITVNGAPSVKIGLADTSGTLTVPGNWNHIFQSFGSGVQVVKNGAGTTIASLQDSNAALTAFQLNIISAFQGDAKGRNVAGLYPAIRNAQGWSNPGGIGTGRVFRLQGLTTGHAYLLKLLCSIDTGFFGSGHLVDITVVGSTTQNFLAQSEDNNTTNLIGGGSGITVTPDASGFITITVTRNAGTAQICVIEIANL